MAQLKALLDSNATRTLLAIAAIAVTIAIYFLNRKRKALWFDVVRNDKLFLLDEELRTRVQVTVDGRLVSDVSLVIIDIVNTGSEPIRKDDFDKPLSFDFGNDAEVISARVLVLQL
jgi:phosphate transport system substrate-binding protein